MSPTATVHPDGNVSPASEGASLWKSLPSKPQFASHLEEREFLKFRLAQAFRIFGNIHNPRLFILPGSFTMPLRRSSGL
jgi:hypothetical protein